MVRRGGEEEVTKGEEGLERRGEEEGQTSDKQESRRRRWWWWTGRNAGRVTGRRREERWRRSLTQVQAVDAQSGVAGVVQPPLLPPAAGRVGVHLSSRHSCRGSQSLLSNELSHWFALVILAAPSNHEPAPAICWTL